MRPLCSRLALIVAALALGGCGFLTGDDGIFRDRSQDYKRAPEPPVIQVPPGKDDQALRDIYVIPEIQDKVLLDGDFEVPRPAPLVADAAAELVRIQRLGDQSWVLVGVPPGQVWPQVRSFLAASNMQVARVDARAGIIDTNWLTLKGAPLPSRFRFRMDQGVQRGTSELHVLQMNRGSGEERDWPARSDDQQQADDMLRAVAQYLADSAESAPVSMLAEQGIRATGKISLQETPEGKTYIRLALPFDRAWASLDKALGKSNFEVVDRDRSAGVYYANFLGPKEEDEEGWFDWLFADEEEIGRGRPFLVTMRAAEPGVVHITLAPEDDSIELDRREEQTLLSLIKGNID